MYWNIRFQASFPAIVYLLYTKNFSSETFCIPPKIAGGFNPAYVCIVFRDTFKLDFGSIFIIQNHCSNTVKQGTPKT